MPSMYVSTANGSYQITFNNRVVTPDEAKQLFNEAVNEYDEFVEMSFSAQRLVNLDFDVDALKQFYKESQ